MKVGFCGSHGTGKTTTAKLFAEKHGWPFVTNVSRYVNSIGYGINEVATVESQAATSMARLAAQVKAMDEHGTFISDRTLLDSMAYNKWQLEHVWEPGIKSQFWYDTMETITKHYMKHYDLIVYVPVIFPLVLDGVRAEDETYRDWVAKAVLKLLFDYGLKFEIMGGDTPEERLLWLENQLTSRGAVL